MSDKEKPEAKPGGKKRNIPMIAIIAVILILNLLVVGKVFLGGKPGAKPVKKVEEVGAKLTLDEFLVNLHGESDHYLKVQLALGLRKDVTEEKLKDETAPIRDAVLSVLSVKTAEELGSESGREKLKNDLKEKVNKELGGEKVLKVYFLTFATQ